MCELLVAGLTSSLDANVVLVLLLRLLPVRSCALISRSMHGDAVRWGCLGMQSGGVVWGHGRLYYSHMPLVYAHVPSCGFSTTSSRCSVWPVRLGRL